MAVKDPNLRALLEKARAETREFLVGGVPLKFSKLTLNDNIEIDKTLGINLFAELAETAASSQEGKVAIPRAWSYAVQRHIFWLSLKKAYPELTLEEAGDLTALLEPQQFWSILTWVLGGTPPSEAAPLG